MLILNQSESDTVNLDNVETIFEEVGGNGPNKGCYVFARGVSGKNTVLGRYKDEARAKKVLREILMEYVRTPPRIYVMPEE